MKIKQYVGVAFGCWVMACTAPGAEVVNQETPYFALNDLIDQQLAQLAPAGLHKRVVMQADTEARTLPQPDWARELDLLRAADINKPAWQGQYQVDTLANTLRYRAKSKDLAVRELQVVRSPSGHLQRVEASLQNINYLYASARHLEMQFADEPTDRLTSYRIRGYQKIRLRDTVHFEVIGQVLPAKKEISQYFPDAF